MSKPLVLLTLALAGGCAPRGGAPGGFAPPDISLTQPQSVAVAGVPQLPGFSTAVKVGTTVYLSGQVPLDTAGQLVGRGDFSAQAVQTFANMAQVIRAARGVPADLVQLTVYVVGYDTSAAGVVRRAVEPYLEPRVPPALTIVGVATLPEPGMLIAADGIAVLRGQLPDKMRDRGR
jgi:enamine deaminase RidA (YjgF/YER057c/UK114 family)